MRRLAFLGTVVLLFAGTVTGGATAVAGPASGLQRIKHTTFTTNWAGYVATGQTFSDVNGTWVQPTAKCPSHGRIGIAAFWVGLDGWETNSPTVEQTGTEAACVGPSPVYFAWYEFFPAGPVALDSSTYPVIPGDTITAEVKHVATNVTITIDSNNSDWPGAFSASISASGLALNSAEWIAEGPTRNLTNFGTLGFTGATASNDAVTYVNHPIGDWAHDDITMVLQQGPFLTTRADPSALGSGDDNFIVTWQHS